MLTLIRNPIPRSNARLPLLRCRAPAHFRTNNKTPSDAALSAADFRRVFAITMLLCYHRDAEKGVVMKRKRLPAEYVSLGLSAVFRKRVGSGTGDEHWARELAAARLISQHQDAYPSLIRVYKIHARGQYIDYEYVNAKPSKHAEPYDVNHRKRVADLRQNLADLHAIGLVFFDLHIGNFGLTTEGTWKVFDFDCSYRTDCASPPWFHHRYGNYFALACLHAARTGDITAAVERVRPYAEVLDDDVMMPEADLGMELRSGRRVSTLLHFPQLQAQVQGYLEGDLTQIDALRFFMAFREVL